MEALGAAAMRAEMEALGGAAAMRAEMEAFRAAGAEAMRGDGSGRNLFRPLSRVNKWMNGSGMDEAIFLSLSASLSKQLLELVKQRAAGPDRDLLLKEIASGIERGLPPDDDDQEHGPDLLAAGDALLLAAQYNYSTALKRILGRPECSALLHHPNAKSESLLHIAAKAGHLKVVKVLLDRARDAGQKQRKRLVQMRSRGGNAALHEAVRSKSLGVVEMIADKGKEMISAANDEGRSPLYIAVENGFVQSVRTMLGKDPAAYRQTGPGGRTLLHAAVISNLGEI